ncbi:MAG: hypothetical protein Q8O94_02940 [bacterium]|nr:hypothetical protein [bacterium]
MDQIKSIENAPLVVGELLQRFDEDVYPRLLSYLGITDDSTQEDLAIAMQSIIGSSANISPDFCRHALRSIMQMIGKYAKEHCLSTSQPSPTVEIANTFEKYFDVEVLDDNGAVVGGWKKTGSKAIRIRAVVPNPSPNPVGKFLVITREEPRDQCSLCYRRKDGGLRIGIENISRANGLLEFKDIERDFNVEKERGYLFTAEDAPIFMRDLCRGINVQILAYDKMEESKVVRFFEQHGFQFLYVVTPRPSNK